MISKLAVVTSISETPSSLTLRANHKQAVHMVRSASLSALMRFWHWGGASETRLLLSLRRLLRSLRCRHHCYFSVSPCLGPPQRTGYRDQSGQRGLMNGADLRYQSGYGGGGAEAVCCGEGVLAVVLCRATLRNQTLCRGEYCSPRVQCVEK